MTPVPTETPPVICHERVINGGFENRKGWRRYHSANTAAIAHDGERAIRLGLIPRGFKPESAPGQEISILRRASRRSSLYQTISLPRGAASITLTFWYWPGTNASRYDRQRVMLLRPRRYTRIKTLMSVLEDDREWKQASFDLSRYAGRKIVLYFQVYNNRTGPKGRTWMYVDDVSIQVCK